MDCVPGSTFENTSNMAGKLIREIFSKPLLKKAVKTVFPDPMDNYRLELMLWDFKKAPTADEWVTITDKQFGGESTAEITQSKSGKVLFRGNLSTLLPEGSEAKQSGICAIRSQPRVDWKGNVVACDTAAFDGIQMKFRGDGRTYALNIQPDSIRSDDLHQSFLYTRGGPYWETVRIPFSKFILTNSGYLQDHQMDFPKMRTFGITLADHINGPFSLEIDYIKMVMFIYQPKHFQYQHDPRQ